VKRPDAAGAACVFHHCERLRADGLKERDAARSELRQLYVKEMSPGVALATVQYVLLKSDGQELERRGVTYMLRKTADGWKIAAAMGHAPDSVLRLD